MITHYNSLPQQVRMYVNSYIRRSFIEHGDMDYIAARLCYRNSLLQNFFWLGSQALEKYFKAILLFNGLPAKDDKHDLAKLLEDVESVSVGFDFNGFIKQVPFSGGLLPKENLKSFLARLTDLGMNRYGTSSYTSYGDELVKLDSAIFEIRRYCRPVFSDHPIIQMQFKAAHDRTCVSIDCYLEKVLSGQKSMSCQHEALMWNNLGWNEAISSTDDFMDFRWISSTKFIDPELAARPNQLSPHDFNLLKTFLFNHVRFSNDQKNFLNSLSGQKTKS